MGAKCVLLCAALLALAASSVAMLTAGARVVAKRSLPDRRHEHAFCSVKGKLAAMGGRGDRKTFLYNDDSGRWEDFGRLPREIHHFQCVQFRNGVVIAGALTGAFPNEPPLREVYYVNFRQNRTTVLGTFPASRRRGAAGVVVRNDRIFIAGGVTRGHGQGTGTSKKWLDVFNPANGRWTRLASMTRARDHGGAAYHRSTDRMFVAGGRVGGAPDFFKPRWAIASIEEYNFNRNRWRVLSTRFRSPHPGQAPAIANGILYIANGEIDKKTFGPEHQTEAYSISQGRLLRSGQIPRFLQRHGAPLVSCGGGIWIAAGAKRPPSGGNIEISSLQVLYPSGSRNRCRPNRNFW